MSEFETETAIAPAGDGSWTTRLAGDWNIGNNSNGGYALTAVLRALRELTGQLDPISVTTHSLYSLVGSIGWVPTVELTVHSRRAPAAGWLRARFECDDLHRGRMIETGALWDSAGALVARCRQIGRLLGD